ncbi:MAG: hypothetical protein JO189_06335 [Deltaproteobacteria bacterium]|nr:hypothetical protein [Deltaproteobacteria bacterium]
MALRDEITSDPNALPEPSRAFEQLQKLTPDQWNWLMLALQKGDRKMAAQIFGATPQQMDDWFKALKQKALDIVKSHPELADPTKGFGK